MRLRKVKDLAGNALSFLVVVFVLGIVFAPMPVFGRYASSTLNVFLAVIPLYIITELYYFAKDAPVRRVAGKKRVKSTARRAAEWALFGLLAALILLARNGMILKQSCPERTEGTPDGGIRIQYFYNAFCPSCWRQEPVVQQVMETYKNRVLLERYDVRYCERSWQDAGVRTVPGFAITSGNHTTIRGRTSFSEFSTLVCDWVGCPPE